MPLDWMINFLSTSLSIAKCIAGPQQRHRTIRLAVIAHFDPVHVCTSFRAPHTPFSKPSDFISIYFSAACQKSVPCKMERKWHKSRATLGMFSIIVFSARFSFLLSLFSFTFHRPNAFLLALLLMYFYLSFFDVRCCAHSQKKNHEKYK